MQRTLIAILVVAVLGAFAAYFYLNKDDLLPATVDGDDQQSEDTLAAPEEVDLGPSFDIVRISSDATAVIAGRAVPGSTVEVMLGEEVLGTVTADQRGEWVLTLDQPLKAGSGRITLKATAPDGEVMTSRGGVVISVPEGAGDALAVLMQPGKASVVLQGLSGMDRALSLDTIDYDGTGNVIMSGRGLTGMSVRVYLDNQSIGGTLIDGNGRWELTPDQSIAPGIYELRVDLLDDKGKVVERIKMPFKREDVSGIKFEKGHVVVQPGNSLWRIARHVYGKGLSYTTIYQANQSQIDDPDLIYPGQIFSVPGVNLDADQ